MTPQQIPAEMRHYENPALWTAQRYLNDAAELKRFNTVSMLLPDNTKTLLDVGTGNGAFMRYLEEQNKPYKMLGLERSTAARAAALCRAGICAGSADALPFADQSFDGVTALEVIEHLPFGTYEKTLEEMQRVATSAIIISVPYREQRRKTVCPYCGCSFNPNYHMRNFDEAYLTTLFSLFKLVKFILVSRPEYVYMPLLRLLRRAWGQTSPFPIFTPCPQCGYSDTDKASAKHPPVRRKRPFIPMREHPVWIVALYQRTPDTPQKA